METEETGEEIEDQIVEEEIEDQIVEGLIEENDLLVEPEVGDLKDG